MFRFSLSHPRIASGDPWKVQAHIPGLRCVSVEPLANPLPAFHAPGRAVAVAFQQAIRAPAPADSLPVRWNREIRVRDTFRGRGPDCRARAVHTGRRQRRKGAAVRRSQPFGSLSSRSEAPGGKRGRMAQTWLAGEVSRGCAPRVAGRRNWSGAVARNIGTPYSRRQPSLPSRRTRCSSRAILNPACKYMDSAAG